MTVSCTSRISHVVVHAQGAIVTRQVKLPDLLPEGRTELHVASITPLAQQGTFRASLGPCERTVLSVQAQWVVPDAMVRPGPSVERVQELERQIARLQAEQRALAEQRELLQAAEIRPGFAARNLRAHPETRTHLALGTSRLLQKLMRSMDGRVIELEEHIRRLSREKTDAELRDMHTPSAERMGQGQPSYRASILLEGQGPVPNLELTYVVQAARWWPVYTLHLSEQATQAQWLIEALVAQCSGEDWDQVHIALSTADLIRDARLPELPSMRLGRAQPPLGAKAYRPAPEGLDKLFEGYRNAFEGGEAKALLAKEVVYSPVSQTDTLQEEEQQELGAMAEQSRSMSYEAGPVGAAAAGYPSPQTMPEGVAFGPPMAVAASPKKAGFAWPSFGGGEKGRMLQEPKPQPMAAAPRGMALAMPAPAPEPALPTAIEPSDAWLDFDSLRLAPVTDRENRGRLVQKPDHQSAQAQQHALARLEQVVLPAHAKAPESSRGHFDHCYPSKALAKVPSDGLTHRLSVAGAEGRCTASLRCVPRESTEVYRELELTNPFEAPLLAGPVDVYVDNSLTVTTPLEHIDRGGTLHLGLGVEPRVRVARNVRSEQESTGLLGGSTLVMHQVSLQLSSSLNARIPIEVLDRLPVTDDKTIEIRLVESTPKAEAYTQEDRGAPVRGGLRWKLMLEPGASPSLQYQYNVVLPSKSELVGGNRRD